MLHTHITYIHTLRGKTSETCLLACCLSGWPGPEQASKQWLTGELPRATDLPLPHTHRVTHRVSPVEASPHTAPGDPSTGGATYICICLILVPCNVCDMRRVHVHCTRQHVLYTRCALYMLCACVRAPLSSGLHRVVPLPIIVRRPARTYHGVMLALCGVSPSARRPPTTQENKKYEKRTGGLEFPSGRAGLA